MNRAIIIRIFLSCALTACSSVVLADPPDARIAVTNDGIVVVEASDLAASLNVPLNDVTAKLTSREVCIKQSGNDVAVFIPPSNDKLFFYGRSIDSVYAKENAYMLRWASGNVATNIPGVPPSPVSVESGYRDVMHFEDDDFTALSYFDDPESDYWFWKYLIPDEPGENVKAFQFHLTGVTSGAPAEIRIHLFGSVTSGTANEHHAAVSLNGNSIGSLQWQGIGATTLVASAASSLLYEGSNTLEITAILNGGVPYSMFYVDSFDVSFNKRCSAVNDHVATPGLVDAVVTVPGFSTSAVYVADVTLENSMGILQGVTVDMTNGSYRASFEPAGTNRKYAVFADSQAVDSGAITAVSGVDLKAATNSGEHLIITVRDFSPAASNLAAYRISKGISSIVVYLDDIYNQFNEGIASPQAIKDFIRYASTNWTKRPKYVVLAGHGTYDYKDNLGYDECIVPPMLVNTPDGMYESDGWYTDFNDDSAPDIAIGRLPAMVNVDLMNMLNKIQTYESCPSGPWTEKVIFLADGRAEFHNSSDNVAAKLPAGISVEKIYLTGSDSAACRVNLINSVNQGAALLNYFGHAGAWTMSQSEMLIIDDIALMDNFTNLIIVTSMSCQMGRFAIPGFDCMGEYFLVSENGAAVATISPSGMAFNERSEAICRSLYDNIFNSSQRIIGDAMLYAMTNYVAAGKSTHIASMYNLIGDPGLMLRPVSRPSDSPYTPLIPALEEWKETIFTQEELDNPSVAGDFADSDNDGIVNIAEYVFAHDPKSVNSEADIAGSGQEPVPEQHDIMIAYKRNKFASGVRQDVFISSDLNSWQDAEPFVVRHTSTDDGNNKTLTVKKYIRTPDTSKAWFVKLKISKEK